MTHFEPVEPRTLFANAGLDPTFAARGVLTLNGVTPRAVLAADNGVFVLTGGSHNADRFVYKFDNRGRPDARFGDNGRAAVEPLTLGTDPRFVAPGANPLAYDPRTATLYVAGTRGTLLGVERFTSRGRRDATFGTRGVITLGTGGLGRTVRYGGLTVLSKGKLLVETRQSTDTSGSSDDLRARADVTTVEQLTLLTRNGVPDASFGTGGVANVLTGALTAVDDDAESPQQTSLSGDLSTFQDIDFTPDGYRVVYTRDRFEETVGLNTKVASVRTSTAYAASYAVSAAGKVDAGATRTYKLRGETLRNARLASGSFYAGDGGQDVVGGYEVAFATGDAAGGVSVVGGTNAAQGAGPTAATVLRLDGSSRKVVALALPTGAGVVDFARAPASAYVYSGSRVTRFFADLSLDTRFGTAGSDTTDATLAALTVDGSGRLLAIDGNRVVRFTA